MIDQMGARGRPSHVIDFCTLTGLQRCGKSCRLRWINYLRPDLKRGGFSSAEEKLIIDLHAGLGNRSTKSSTSMAILTMSSFSSLCPFDAQNCFTTQLM